MYFYKTCAIRYLYEVSATRMCAAIVCAGLECRFMVGFDRESICHSTLFVGDKMRFLDELE